MVSKIASDLSHVRQKEDTRTQKERLAMDKEIVLAYEGERTDVFHTAKLISGATGQSLIKWQDRPGAPVQIRNTKIDLTPSKKCVKDQQDLWEAKRCKMNDANKAVWVVDGREHHPAFLVEHGAG